MVELAQQREVTLHVVYTKAQTLNKIREFSAYQERTRKRPRQFQSKDRKLTRNRGPVVLRGRHRTAASGLSPSPICLPRTAGAQPP